jgi:hypothetical protein
MTTTPSRPSSRSWQSCRASEGRRGWEWGWMGRERPLVQSSVALNDGDLRAGRAGAGAVPWPARRGGERGVEGGATAKPISFRALFVTLHSPLALLPHSAVRDTSMASSSIQHDAVQIHHKTYVRALFNCCLVLQRFVAICHRPPVQRRHLLRPNPPGQRVLGTPVCPGRGPRTRRRPLSRARAITPSPPLPPFPPRRPPSESAQSWPGTRPSARPPSSSW